MTEGKIFKARIGIINALFLRGSCSKRAGKRGRGRKMGGSRIPGNIRIDIGPHGRKPSPFPPRPAPAACPRGFPFYKNDSSPQVVNPPSRRFRSSSGESPFISTTPSRKARCRRRISCRKNVTEVSGAGKGGKVRDRPDSQVHDSPLSRSREICFPGGKIVI
jgi:hypothetical protein